jgi:ABC-type multidrug transport system fused ATPase/permease subunit
MGKDIKEYQKVFLENNIAIVPQKAVLFSGTIRDNIKWGAPNATDEEIYEALSIAQALNVAEEKGGLDAKVEAGGKNFSGGQRQRLTIARALIKKPEVLILDDSASALDYATDSALRIALRDKLKDTTVFIVSQRTASVMHADNILLMEDGQISASGKHSELLSASGAYKEIYESQFGGEVS